MKPSRFAPITGVVLAASLVAPAQAAISQSELNREVQNSITVGHVTVKVIGTTVRLYGATDRSARRHAENIAWSYPEVTRVVNHITSPRG